MIRATFSYLSAPSAHFDFDYYVDRHVPLARRLLEPVRIEVDRCVSAEERGSAPRAVCVAHLYFATLDDYYRGLETHGDALGRDVPNYTNAELEVLVSEILG
ncbi:MAG TPA: EthD family reductase [Polyangiaceae bacterium]|nr:EthD family reductase [Polyangiaceae bacterium]